MRLLAAGLVLFTALAGCGWIGDGGHDAVSYDLRRPPTRADVGMPDGEKVVVDEAEENYPVTLLLPGGRRLETEVSLTTFDSYSAGTKAGSADPTSADLHTARTSLDEAAASMESALRQLGRPTAAVDDWTRRARVAKGLATVRSDAPRVELGYPRIGIQGRYSPRDERATIAYSLYWGPG